MAESIQYEQDEQNAHMKTRPLVFVGSSMVDGQNRVSGSKASKAGAGRGDAAAELKARQMAAALRKKQE